VITSADLPKLVVGREVDSAQKFLFDTSTGPRIINADPGT